MSVEPSASEATPGEFRPLLPTLERTQPAWKRVLYLGGAILLFVVGILGWLVPVITGIPFYVAALILLGMGSPRVRDWINRLEARLSPRWRRRLRDGIAKIPIRKIRAMVE